MKALVNTFNQEKALVGAFSVIVQLRRLIVYSTSHMSHVTHVSTLTSHDQLRGEVCGGRGVGGDAGVGAAVLGRQAEEEDVAGEHVVLDLVNKYEVINVLVFLDTFFIPARRGRGRTPCRPCATGCLWACRRRRWCRTPGTCGQ